MVLVRSRSRAVVASLVAAGFLLGAGSALLGTCGPFTDVAADAFCPFVLEIFYLGITTGTTATTYDPGGNVTRLQMAAFLSRTVDRTLQRTSRRAALKQFAAGPSNLATTTFGRLDLDNALLAESDGTDVWVSGGIAGDVYRVRGSDGRLLETWTGGNDLTGLLVAMGQVFAAGQTSPGRLHWINPSQPAGAMTTVATNLGNAPQSLAFDGSRIWSANLATSVSIVTPGASIPWTVTTVMIGTGVPNGISFDGSAIWVSNGVNKVFKLDAAAAILQTVTVGNEPHVPVFDGTNLWVPNADSDSISVVRASSGAVLATLTGNGMDRPIAVAFDGQRILATSFLNDSVSLWKAADLTAAGSFATGAGSQPFGACSDGANFWVVLLGTEKLLRF